MTKERRYALVQPSDEIQASEVHRRWSEVGSPRLNEEDEIGGLVQQVRERLERDLDGTVAALAGLDSDAQDA